MVSSKPACNPDQVEQLLALGLEYFAVNRQADAVAAWREVLRLSPGEPRATDYLEAAGVDPHAQRGTIAPVIELDMHRPREPQTDEPWREAIVSLVAQGHLEEALELLYREGAKRPGQADISRSIRDIKSKLCFDAAKQLGGLDRVLQRAEARPAQTFEQRAVLKRVDGVATADDIASSSPLGRFRCLQVLVELFVVRPAKPDEPVGEVTREIARGSVPLSETRPSFDELFARAIAASVHRHYEEAERLFVECEQLRPADSRVHANLARLRKRRGGSPESA